MNGSVRGAVAALSFVALSACAGRAASGAPLPRVPVDSLLPDAVAAYQEIHAHPELSGHEVRTSALLAAKLRALGYSVTEGVGGTGVVGVLRHGAGRTLMIRTELDALPVPERTGLPYASQVRTRDDAGNDVPVMHACGHDLHMATWLATAMLAAREPSLFPGTVVFVAQPAEETLSGARRMLDDGLFTRFPRPDAVLAIHAHDALGAGLVAYTAGPFAAASDNIDVTVFGRGGHGAYPQTAIDPIVVAARTVLALQTVVSREHDPREPLVLTVGAISGGTKHNVIPDSVALKLTLRSYGEEARSRALVAIRRIVAGEAAAGGALAPPTVEIVEHTEIASSDPALTHKVVNALAPALGGAPQVEIPKEMGSEDFSEYERAGVPGVYLFVGVVPPASVAAWKNGGKPPPSDHSSEFAPDLVPSLRAAITVEVTAARTLLVAK